MTKSSFDSWVLEFEEWFNTTGYYYGPGFEYHKRSQLVAWIAAKSSSQKTIIELEEEIKKLIKEIPDIRHGGFP